MVSTNFGLNKPKNPEKLAFQPAYNLFLLNKLNNGLITPLFI